MFYCLTVKCINLIRNKSILVMSILFSEVIQLNKTSFLTISTVQFQQLSHTGSFLFVTPIHVMTVIYFTGTVKTTWNSIGRKWTWFIAVKTMIPSRTLLSLITQSHSEKLLSLLWFYCADIIWLHFIKLLLFYIY